MAEVKTGSVATDINTPTVVTFDAAVPLVMLAIVGSAGRAAVEKNVGSPGAGTLSATASDSVPVGVGFVPIGGKSGIKTLSMYGDSGLTYHIVVPTHNTVRDGVPTA